MCVLHICIFTPSAQEYVASSKHLEHVFSYSCGVHVALNCCCFCIPEACLYVSSRLTVPKNEVVPPFTGWLYPQLEALIYTRD